MPSKSSKSRKNVLTALSLQSEHMSALETLAHVATVKRLSVDVLNINPLVIAKNVPFKSSKNMAGAHSTSNMSEVSSTCSSIDNSSLESLCSSASSEDNRSQERSGRTDGRDNEMGEQDENAPRTRSSSRKRSLESKKRASQKKNKKRREREAAAKREKRLLIAAGTAMADTEPSNDLLPSPTTSTSSSTSLNSPTLESSDAHMAAAATIRSDQAVAVTQDVMEKDRIDQNDNASPVSQSDIIIMTKTSEQLQEHGVEVSSDKQLSAAAATEGVVESAQVELEAIPEEQSGEDDEEQVLNEKFANASPEMDRREVEDRTGSRSHTNYIQNRRLISAESIAHLPTWDVASETVATVAIQCLTRDKDMELSYVAILSAVTVLQGKKRDDSNSSLSFHDICDKVANMYDQLLAIMCDANMSQSLDQETIRQGIIAPHELFTQLYNGVMQAGYTLKRETHLAVANYLIHHTRIKEAQACISHIDETQWDDNVFRAAIVCCLMAKPRQLQEAESMLEKYISHQEQLASPQAQSQNVDSVCRTWFKTQLDASKWNDVKTQYQRRRARLLDPPENIDRMVTEQADKSNAEASLHNEHTLSTSASPSTAASHQRSPSGHQRSHSGHQTTPLPEVPTWPSGASATLNVSPTVDAAAPVAARRPFSFLSSLKFSSKSGDTNTKASDALSLPSRIHTNHHLTVLDNAMLEDCIRHKAFEYGWSQIYEHMGSALEDNETSRIVMRLCKQAFMESRQSATSDEVLKEVDKATEDQKRTSAVMFDANDASHHRHQDPELWEARAWAVYNKTMVNPHPFTTNVAQSAGSDSGANGVSTSPTALFFHDILTVAMYSPETSSRFLKAFKVYSALRSDPQNQQLLRDPFVMTCMLKAIYEAVLVVVNNPEQQTPLPSSKEASASRRKQHHRRSSSLSLNRTQPMTLGPLMDLAFEIYADMRQVGSIRHLPSLIQLAPSSPTGRSRRSSMIFASSSSPMPPSPTRPESTEEGTDDKTDTSPTGAESPRSSVSAMMTLPVLQGLNPTLKANAQAKRLPTEIYLALLHMCIQVPVFRVSSQIVKTVLDDMAASTSRSSACHLDQHLAAALQQYHDTWMCADVDAKASCVYRRWMYKPEKDIQEHIKDNESESDSDSDVQGNNSDDQATLEGMEDVGCNDAFFWDLWSADDAQLKDVLFTQQRVALLVKHIRATLL
ncbi:hypothetical protein BGZ94_003487 [Podila epigama]|nr:hypothetical protein BGZ94_003487 [Podila epigama]